MSKKIFTEQEILELSKNKYVKNVTAKGITYTNEFKLQFIAEYENGKTSRKIFEDAGFDVDVIGIKRIESASLRWRAAYKDKGVLGLEDTRTLNSGRTLNRDLTVEEILAKKDAEIAYLKAELELIKKLELQERQVISKKIPSSIIFNLIQNLIKNFETKGVKMYCVSGMKFSFHLKAKENFVHKYYSNDIEVISARSQELKCDAVKIIKRINNCDFNEIIFIDDIKENIIRFNNMGINAYTPEEWEQLI